MPTCPKCFYQLVFLERRGKYKCSKCGKLFYQKEIETKEFVEWNKRERKKEKEAFYGKPQKQKELSEYEKKQRMRLASKKWYYNNLEKVGTYYKKNRERIIQQKRKYRKSLSGQRKILDNEKRKARRCENMEDTRANARIEYWKRRQKELALKKLEFTMERACTIEIQRSLPTYALSELLGV